MAATNPTPTDVSAIRNYLFQLQDRICTALETADRARIFREDRWQRPEGGEGSTRVLANGRIFERAGVAVSHVRGPALPPSATSRHPHLAGRAFEAMGISLVIHPESPYVPTTHMNLRFFRAAPAAAGEGEWWFGGGYDLTPYIVSPVDFAHWHRTAKAACDPFGTDLYPRFKQACDEYFFLPHRGEARGIGGVFFDDFSEGGLDASFALARSIGDSFLPAYLPIVARRGTLGYSERERSHQLYRRGRYAEFNLVYDRGTQFGLQSGGRTESILLSMPPLAAWTYNWKPEPGSAEAELLEILQHPRNWV